MSRILFLDDSPARQRWALKEMGPGNDLDRPEDAGGAIALLGASMTSPAHVPPYDEAYLDHDLGGETFVDPSLPNTGMAVVRWIVAHRPEIGRIVVHSCNEPAAMGMVATLLEAGYDVEYLNFLRLIRLYP